MGLQYILGTPPQERWRGDGLAVGSSHTKAWECDWEGKKGARTPGAILSWVWGLGKGQHGEKPGRLGSRTPGHGAGRWP